MRLPRIKSLYGRIFAIFWFTMLLVLLAVLSLPHLDPRKAHEIPNAHKDKLIDIKEKVEHRFKDETDLGRILFRLNDQKRSSRDPSPRLYLTDLEGNILTTKRESHFGIRALRNFVTSLPDDSPKQKLYGNYMIAGPTPITLADRELKLYVGVRWNQPPPLLLRMFDKPIQLLFAVMIVSTPLLLWLAWVVSQPARKLERAAKRVAQGEFVADPELEQGTSEFRQAGASFNQMVEAVNNMVSGQQRLLSDISHELRSPLTRLRMASALAVRKQGESPELERIDTEAQRLELMINELLALSRTQADSHLQRETQPLSSLWEEIIKDAQFEAEQMGKTLNYSTLPDCKLTGSPKLLMRALDNILRNAIHYGKDQVDVTIVIKGENLHVSVQDNGEGVPEEELEDIFRPFYRVSTARDRHSGGTGLGLAITQTAIRQHSGTIKAKRGKLGGLQVDIVLPLSLGK
ncbi:envelope stress sensor histidine kinase CpxA [Vibrio mexicanus]|uniref:envelope stress sensor histidine kinase CpxA n=1 Tax=Vibrio mexicanus TaxID=1004326 RepID=UPI00063CB344|nr:envelope stress sensor histidine kinase CpxA [Vibrio mexicanus]